MSDLEPTAVPRERLFDDPNLLPLLPMVYVAWSDGDFDADEMAAVCKAIRSKARLDQPCDALLARWLDHDDPPSSRELSDLLQTIRARADGLNRRQRVSLAELGLEIARASDGVSTVERDALVAIEEQMGVLGSEAARQLLASRRPPAPAVHREPTFPIAVLTRWLDGDQRPVRERVRAMLRAPAFAYPEVERPRGGPCVDTGTDSRSRRGRARRLELPGRGWRGTLDRGVRGHIRDLGASRLERGHQVRRPVRSLRRQHLEPRYRAAS